MNLNSILSIRNSCYHDDLIIITMKDVIIYLEKSDQINFLTE